MTPILYLKARSQAAFAALGPLAILAAACAAAPVAAQAQTPPSGTLTSLYAFPGVTNTQGAPYNAPALTLGSDGNFYGTRSIGGNRYGSIFKETPAGVVTTLYTFKGASDGKYPFGELVQTSDGNFYGVTQSTLFRLTPSGTLTTLYTFSATDPNGVGYLPAGGLTLDSGLGVIFGVCEFGGANGTGTVFGFHPNASSVQPSVYYTFSADPSNGNPNTHSGRAGNADGAYPNAPAAIGSDGNLYGTTANGGVDDYGTVYRIDLHTAVFNSLYAFTGNEDGAQLDENQGAPAGALVQLSDGSFYGVTGTGGGGTDSNGVPYDTGVAYKITASGALTSLHVFSAVTNNVNADGAYPVGGLTLGSDGALYGTTEFGGASGTGTVFRLLPSGGDGALTPLHSFAAATSSANSTNADGDYPESTLLSTGGGIYYGATGYGGKNGTGTLYKLQVTSSQVPPPAPAAEARFDFNQDGHADLLWYNSSSGAVSVWDANDQTVLSYGAAFTQLAPSTGWVPVASPDVNGDKYPDLLWWNKNTGELSIWTLKNTAVTNYGGDFATLSDTHWKPVAAADVTGSAWELVFQNTATGAISVWQMNGTTVTSYGSTLATLGANSPYQIVGAPDIDGDGRSDLLFWNSGTGEVSYWSCNLTTPQVLATHGAFAQLADASWHLVGSEDTNGDGSSDLLWWNANTGEFSRWLLSRATVTQYGGDTARVTDTTWSPTAIR